METGPDNVSDENERRDRHGTRHCLSNPRQSSEHSAALADARPAWCRRHPSHTQTFDCLSSPRTRPVSSSPVLAAPPSASVLRDEQRCVLQKRSQHSGPCSESQCHSPSEDIQQRLEFYVFFVRVPFQEVDVDIIVDCAPVHCSVVELGEHPDPLVSDC